MRYTPRNCSSPAGYALIGGGTPNSAPHFRGGPV
jgi:hypothetical protein